MLRLILLASTVALGLSSGAAFASSNGYLGAPGMSVTTAPTGQSAPWGKTDSAVSGYLEQDATPATGPATTQLPTPSHGSHHYVYLFPPDEFGGGGN